MADWTASLDYVFRIALAIANGEKTVPDSYQLLTAHWRDPRYTSKAAQADAGAKQLASIEWLKETTTGLELLGLDSRQIEMALAQRKQAEARSFLDSLISRGTEEAVPDGYQGEPGQ